jgi:nucleotide-binding universal stress UspA family protein
MTSQPPLGPPFKIVVGVDYSESSTLALQAALLLASGRPDAQIYALAVGEGLLSRPEQIVEEAQREFRDQAQKTLDTFLAEQIALFEKTGVRLNHKRVAAAVDFGSPSERILALAEELKADMIVIGTHGRAGIQRLLVGSVAENVLRHSHCTVLVARQKHHASA